MSGTNAQHKWRFFRATGSDLVLLETGADLQHLAELDPKLWAVLNCPTTGLEFDTRTAKLLDESADGQMRVPEILSAVRWSCDRLADVDVMFAPEGLPLDAIATHDEEGQALKAAALNVLTYMGKGADEPLQVADVSDMTRLFSADHFNGDGIVVAELTEDGDLKQLIGEIVATQGGQVDRCGSEGVNSDTLAAFYDAAQAVVAWHAAGAADEENIRPLGDATAAAAEAFGKVQAKVEDCFVRCQLAAFDPRAVETLNPGKAVYDGLGNRAVSRSDDDIAALPLAAIGAGRDLPLEEGINPAWAGAVQQLKEKVIEPMLGEARTSLGVGEWATISASLAAWQQWQAGRPDTKVHDLGLERIEAIVAAPEARARIEALIARDLEAKPFADNVDAVERLVRYQRDLVTLLRNFVSMSDFYQGDKKAIFQAGTLYLDQRSCELVLRIPDLTRHTTMAPFSGCYLVYCTCERTGEQPITIAAALTGGDVDETMVPGRNGVFYDRQGRDWSATVIKVMTQPVSIPQAFWSPYKRVAAFVESQLRNYAASRDQDIESRTNAGVTNVGKPVEGPGAFDIAKFAGIFAALGLAAAALGASLTAIAAGLFSLSWWQVPLVLFGVMLLISGPSMLMAFLTLRRRNIGPLLDAKGWAVNTRARISVPFGASLTGLAHLPPGARRTMTDKATRRNRLGLGLLVLGMAAVLFFGVRSCMEARTAGEMADVQEEVLAEEAPPVDAPEEVAPEEAP